jgi:hypothetical protein
MKQLPGRSEQFDPGWSVAREALILGGCMPVAPALLEVLGSHAKKYIEHWVTVISV